MPLTFHKAYLNCYTPKLSVWFGVKSLACSSSQSEGMANLEIGFFAAFWCFLGVNPFFWPHDHLSAVACHTYLESLRSSGHFRLSWTNVSAFYEFSEFCRKLHLHFDYTWDCVICLIKTVSVSTHTCRGVPSRVEKFISEDSLVQRDHGSIWSSWLVAVNHGFFNRYKSNRSEHKHATKV